MSFDQDSFGESLTYDPDRSMTLVERLGYVKQLLFSRTKLEFRILWNKIFQKDDEELGWLLNPYRQSSTRRDDATMMAAFSAGDSYQYNYDDVSGTFGRERVTIHNRGLARRSDARKKRQRDNRTLGEKALQVARYMGMGVYMTTSAFPSPFMPVNDLDLYDTKSYCYNQESKYQTNANEYYTAYTMSKIW